MTTVIDRRLNPKDKNLKNRQKFIDVHRKQIADSVKKILDSGKVSDVLGNNGKISINPIKEPIFRNDRKKGDKKYVLPGNEKYVTGNKQDKEKQDSGSGGNEGSPDGEGEDDFSFSLTEEEFLEFVFEDLALPDLVKKQIKDVTDIEFKRSGYKTQGSPNQINIIRSAKNAIGRRIGLNRPSKSKVEKLKLLIEQEENEKIRNVLIEDLARYLKKSRSIPWIDPIDIRYNNHIVVPKPKSKAVMFCLMDVSYSMNEEKKNISKRFFMLLNMFLRKKYDKVDVVFISHHIHAKEVDHDEFFYSKESGGTVVSTSLRLANKIIRERYNIDDWNIYCAQASDGDNSSGDSDEAVEELNKILKLTQYFAYIEVADQHDMAMYNNSWYNTNDYNTYLWQCYEPIAKLEKKFNMKKIIDKNHVWTVFSELFQKDKSYV